MMQFRKHSQSKIDFRSILSSQKTIAFIGLFVLVMISIPLYRNLQQKKLIDSEIKALEKEISEVETKNRDLRKLIDYFESDQFIEEQARLNFGMKKNGENVAVIKNDPLAIASSSQDASNPSQQIFNVPGLKNARSPIPESNASKWWRYFFNKI